MLLIFTFPQTDSNEAVEKVLSGEKPGKTKAPKEKPSKSSSDKPKVCTPFHSEYLFVFEKVLSVCLNRLNAAYNLYIYFVKSALVRMSYFSVHSLYYRTTSTLLIKCRCSSLLAC